MVLSDSTTVCLYIRRQGGTKSRLLCQGTIDLLHSAAALGFSLQSRHIPGRLNGIADGLSRKQLHTEWTLHPEVFAQILASFPTDVSRRVRNTLQSSVASLRVPVSGRRRGSGRRTSGRLGRGGSLRLPTDGDTPQSTQQTATQSVCDDVSGPLIVESVMDHAVVGGGDGSTETVTPETRSAVSTRVPGTTRRSRQPEPACLQTVLRRQGFSESIITRILCSRRASTLDVYAAKWRVFERWCRASNLGSIDLAAKHLCDFFEYLFVRLKLQPITIKGYRSAISRVYRLCGLADPGQNQLISALMANFEIERPRRQTLFPKWSLDIVLGYLSSELFTSSRPITRQHLTYKTVLLLGLASGDRVSELRALPPERTVCTST
jgi:hypothetical protein